METSSEPSRMESTASKSEEGDEKGKRVCEKRNIPEHDLVETVLYLL